MSENEYVSTECTDNIGNEYVAIECSDKTEKEYVSNECASTQDEDVLADLDPSMSIIQLHTVLKDTMDKVESIDAQVVLLAASVKELQEQQMTLLRCKMKLGEQLKNIYALMDDRWLDLSNVLPTNNNTIQKQRKQRRRRRRRSSATRKPYTHKPVLQS